MTFSGGKRHRRSIRLKSYDYARAGAYFVTMCIKDRACLFGDVVDGQMRLNECGRVVADSWLWLSVRYPHVDLDEWVVMPNHLHGIIILTGPDGRGGWQTADGRGGSRTAPTENRKPLGRLIGAFKTVSTKRLNTMRNTPGVPVWQRNYYEHIVRSEESLDHIRRYIVDNPVRWNEDRENPNAVGAVGKPWVVGAVGEPPLPDGPEIEAGS